MSKTQPDSDLTLEFARRLRELRRTKNLTQGEVAKVTDLSYVYIGRLEKGVSQPTADVIRRLANALGVSAGFLLDGSNEQDAGGFEDVELAQQFKQLATLPNDEKAIIKGVVDAFLFRRRVQNLSASS